MRVVSKPRPLILIAAASLAVGVVMLVPGPRVDAAPPLCDGKAATIVGTSGDDELTGTGGDDVIVGLGGDDRIVGGAGNDTLCGFNGDDTLIGGEGDDVIFGGGGSDWIAHGIAPTAVKVNLAAGTVVGWGSRHTPVN